MDDWLAPDIGFKDHIAQCSSNVQSTPEQRSITKANHPGVLLLRRCKNERFFLPGVIYTEVSFPF